METLTILIRFAQFYTHIAHNKAKGALFFQDHEFLGGLYSKFEGYYDDLVERMIGLGLNPDLISINIEASNLLKEYKEDIDKNSEYFTNIYSISNKILEKIKEINKDQSLGTQNLIQDIADQLEKEIGYKIGQRLK